MRVAWSVGHDPVHAGAFSDPLGKTEHELAKMVVEAGKQIVDQSGEDIVLFNPSEYVRSDGKSAGMVLRDKIAMINGWGADVALESHFNAAGNPEARGCETLYFSLPVGNRFSPKGKILAELVQEETLRFLNDIPFRMARPAFIVRDRGAKGMASLKRVYNGVETVPRYAFLTQTKMPAIILEPLFISSSLDTFLLKGELEKEIYRLALAVVSALRRWKKQFC